MPSSWVRCPRVAPKCSRHASMQLYCSTWTSPSRLTAERSGEPRPRAAWSTPRPPLRRTGLRATTLADVAEHADVAPRRSTCTSRPRRRCCFGASPSPSPATPSRSPSPIGRRWPRPWARRRSRKAPSHGGAHRVAHGADWATARRGLPSRPVRARDGRGRGRWPRRYEGGAAQVLARTTRTAAPAIGRSRVAHRTATLFAHAETYLLIGKTTGWDSDTYRDWLVTTWQDSQRAAPDHLAESAQAVRPGDPNDDLPPNGTGGKSLPSHRTHPRRRSETPRSDVTSRVRLVLVVVFAQAESPCSAQQSASVDGMPPCRLIGEPMNDRWRTG